MSDITLDWSRGTVAAGESHVELSRTELRLLSGLLEADGKTVSRQTLISRVWTPSNGSEGPHDIAGRDNALAVYIHMLRKRLGAIGLAHCVRTERGVGYSITLEPRFTRSGTLRAG